MGWARPGAVTTYSARPSGLSARASGYQPVGINPITLSAPLRGARTATASSLPRLTYTRPRGPATLAFGESLCSPICETPSSAALASPGRKLASVASSASADKTWPAGATARPVGRDPGLTVGADPRAL